MNLKCAKILNRKKTTSEEYRLRDSNHKTFWKM